MSDKVSSSDEKKNRGYQSFSFDNPPKSVAYTKPRLLTLGDDRVEVDSWCKVLIGVVQYSLVHHPKAVKSLVNWETPFRKTILLASKEEFLRSPRKIAGGIYLEMNYSAHAIVKIICGLAKFCGFPADKFSVEYSEEKKEKVESQCEEETDSFSRILQLCFPNGFCPNSFIDKKKFAQKYIEIYGREPVEDVENWMERDEVLTVQNKLFVLPESAYDIVCEKIQEFLQSGATLIYYSELYNVNVTEFLEHNIGSQELLAEMIRARYADYTCDKDYFCSQKNATVENEILRAFGEDTSLSCDVLRKRLPGIPRENIHQEMAHSSRFLGNALAFAVADKILFDEEEIAQNREKIDRTIKEQGFVSIHSLNWENCQSLNPSLSAKIIISLIIKMYYADSLTVKNSIIFPVGTKISAAEIMRAFCREKGRFTLQEIRSLEEELNGRAYCQGLDIAQSIAIQVDETHFISTSEVDFDVDGIDSVLETLIPGKAFPLLELSTFTLFPAVPGYPWTSYMLRSFCQLKSKRFSFMSQAANNVCAGAIYRKTASFRNYSHLVAEQALADHVPMDVASVRDYAIRRGFHVRKSDLTFEKVVAAMRDISNREN